MCFDCNISFIAAGGQLFLLIFLFALSYWMCCLPCCLACCMGKDENVKGNRILEWDTVSTCASTLDTVSYQGKARQGKALTVAGAEHILKSPFLPVPNFFFLKCSFSLISSCPFPFSVLQKHVLPSSLPSCAYLSISSSQTDTLSCR